MELKRISCIGLGTLALLLVPLAFTLMNPAAHLSGGGGGGFDWTPGDFAVMGVLLFTAGVALDIVWRKAGRHRVAAAALLAFLFLWLWVELAVGLFTAWGS
jgi:hypothetical protein